MKVFITGGGGQLGRELQGVTMAGAQVTAMGSSELDICDERAVERTLECIRPDLIINAAAYTAVDKAEEEAERAFEVNAHGAEVLARCASRLAARFIHVSTDFVFDGGKSRPYLPEDSTNPLGAYGASKLEGEKMVTGVLGGRALIIRTSWLYSRHGANFVKTMLRLMRERNRLGIVSDQTGTPTWARGLAGVIWRSAERNLTGIHHWSDSGVASWYDFAMAIFEEGRRLGLLEKEVDIIPISTAEYPTPARRPFYSVLDKSAICTAMDIAPPPHWRVNLREMLKEMDQEDDT